MDAPVHCRGWRCGYCWRRVAVGLLAVVLVIAAYGAAYVIGTRCFRGRP